MRFERRVLDDDRRAASPAFYRDPTGRERSAGTFASKRGGRASRRRRGGRARGRQLDRPGRARSRSGTTSSRRWWPSRHLEVSTRAGYRCYLDKHFLPFFGRCRWRTSCPRPCRPGSPKLPVGPVGARVVKYHVMLHSVFKRAVRDRVILHNPCVRPSCPRSCSRSAHPHAGGVRRGCSPRSPSRYVALVLTDIETGLRWGELIALRPRHIDFLRRTHSPSRRPSSRSPGRTRPPVSG